MTSVHMPESIEYIDSAAFSDCTALTVVHIPESVKTIEFYAFKDCTELTSIYLPEGIESISRDAFSNCKKLTIYGKKGSVAETFAKENQFPFLDTSEASQTPDQSGEQR